MKLKTLDSLDYAGKTILVRVDYNVPLHDGKVGDPLRILASLPTLRKLMEAGCKLVLISHLGRPDGERKPEYSLRPVAAKLSELLEQEVTFVDDCVGDAATAAVAKLEPGQIVMLENLRYHAAEEENDPEFARQLAAHGELFVDDAFAVVHRAHASTVGVAQLLPSAAGLLVEQEVHHIGGALDNPTRPLVAVVGGAKVAGKIDVLKNFLNYVDKLVIGGAMANTFLAADGKQVGKSLQDPDDYGLAREIVALAMEKEVELVLPEDVIVAKDPKVDEPGNLVELDGVAADDWIVDLGPRTIARIINPVDFKGTIIWNGPLGVTEVPAFAHNSLLLAHNIIDSGCTGIIGGGDTAAFVDEAGLHDKFTWVSTGGGASLELLAGRELPGLAVLEDK